MQKAFIFLVIIFLVNAVGMYFGFYMKFWWFDMSLHFLGGFFMAMFMAHYLMDVKMPSKLKGFLIIGSTVTLIGVLWEFAEYLASQTLIEPLYRTFGIKTYFIGDLEDTMSDLLMDMIGAFSWLTIYKSRAKSFLK